MNVKQDLSPILGYLLLAGCSGLHSPGASQLRPDKAAADEVTNSFGIYLIAEGTPPTFISGNLSHVVLKSPPIISEHDIVAVDLTNGILKLRPDVSDRLPRISVDGTPFVVIADGERLFRGAFFTRLSSQLPRASALIDYLPGQDYLSLSWFDRRSGKASTGLWLDEEEVEGDPWSDPRLKRCLGRPHKLRP